MNLYFSIYCRTCKWYDTTGTKDEDTLRISTMSLLSALPTFNIMSIILIISLLVRHTLISKWVPVVVFAIFFISNILLISRSKSINIRSNYEGLSTNFKRKINKLFYIYLISTMVILIGIVICTAVYKHRYGNYDLESGLIN
jgi:hypothetical protein